MTWSQFGLASIAICERFSVTSFSETRPRKEEDDDDLQELEAWAS
jgi:hypothetical protein